MSTGETAGPIHPERTRLSHHRYQFYEKHHGSDDSYVAQWKPDLSQDDEFAIFDTADFHVVSDEKGSLYFYCIRTIHSGTCFTGSACDFYSLRWSRTERKTKRGALTAGSLGKAGFSPKY